MKRETQILADKVADTIMKTFEAFGLEVASITSTEGASVTLYEVVPTKGTRVNSYLNLEDEMSMALKSTGVRISLITERGVIGIEVPKKESETVNFQPYFGCGIMKLPINFGETIDGKPYVVDLATMPHLLMAGATGQGKSVGINIILASLLCKVQQDDINLILIDPKKVELSIYEPIAKVVTDLDEVPALLNRQCELMDYRYNLLKDARVRNISEYNAKFPQDKLDYVVIVIDEFADLIMQSGKEVENSIVRLAQLARAVGIHLVIATQRPSADIITGRIKANFPTRVSFRVSSGVDSRTILDETGAEKLIGKGDMLIKQGIKTTRVQCAYISTEQTQEVIESVIEAN